jgi:hypothetical protein
MELFFIIIFKQIMKTTQVLALFQLKEARKSFLISFYLF